MNDQSINYSYLSGFLQSTIKGVTSLLEREGIIEYGSPEYKKVQDIIDKELKRAVEAERQFSSR